MFRGAELPPIPALPPLPPAPEEISLLPPPHAERIAPAIDPMVANVNARRVLLTGVVTGDWLLDSDESVRPVGIPSNVTRLLPAFVFLSLTDSSSI